MSEKGVKVALVLGSGGARGYAHLGVIEALKEKQYTYRLNCWLKCRGNSWCIICWKARCEYFKGFVAKLKTQRLGRFFI